MSRIDGALIPAFRDMEECIQDFANGGCVRIEQCIRRLLKCADAELLSAFLASVVVPIDFEAWWKSRDERIRNTGGFGAEDLDLPDDREGRVFASLELLRRLDSGAINIDDYLVTFHCTAGSDARALNSAFLRDVLNPLVRDIRRLVEGRRLPAGVAELARAFKSSGDESFDRLLAEAVRLFNDSEPTTNRLALDKLWDAWEWLKCMDIPSDPRKSIESRIRKRCGDGPFAQSVNDEAKALTNIGNMFRIRHHNPKTSELKSDSEVDYLFHRMLALLNLLAPMQ